MDKDIETLYLIRSYMPIVAWNLIAAVVAAIFLLTDLKLWPASCVIGLIAMVGNYIWFRRRASGAHPIAFLRLDNLQITGLALGSVALVAWTIYDYQPKKLVIVLVAIVLLWLRIAARKSLNAKNK